MGSLGSPKIWVPYLNNKDCSLGFCSLYCPQWCYVINSPPPHLNFPDGGGDGGGSSSSSSSPNFSPLVVAIIGILASAFLLVSYYTIISKYCGSNRNDRGTTRRTPTPSNDFDELGDSETRNPTAAHEPWHVSATAGLDEALIKTMAVCKYKRGDGSVEGISDCSVCLSEFRDDESLRLLPKCNHAFHVRCIDVWLRSHSNCPLCRANVVVDDSSTTTTINEYYYSGDHSSSGSEEVTSSSENNNNNDNNSDSNVGDSSATISDVEERHSTIIEVRDEIRRSISMDFSRANGRVSVADVLRTNCGSDDEDVEEGNRASCSKLNVNERKGIGMKRSVSSGRFFLTRSLGSGVGRGKISAVIPL